MVYIPGDGRLLLLCVLIRLEMKTIAGGRHGSRGELEVKRHGQVKGDCTGGEATDLSAL